MQVAAAWCGDTQTKDWQREPSWTSLVLSSADALVVAAAANAAANAADTATARHRYWHHYHYLRRRRYRPRALCRCRRALILAWIRQGCGREAQSPPISPLCSQFMPKHSFPVVSSFSAWCAHVSSKRTTWRSSSHLVDLSNDGVTVQCSNSSMPTFESPAFLIPASTFQRLTDMCRPAQIQITPLPSDAATTTDTGCAADAEHCA